MSLGVLLLCMCSSLTAACCNLGVTNVSLNIYCKVMPTPSKIYLFDRVDSQSQYLIIIQNYIISTKILPQIKQQIFSVIHSCYGKQVRVVGEVRPGAIIGKLLRTHISFVNNDLDEHIFTFQFTAKSEWYGEAFQKRECCHIIPRSGHLHSIKGFTFEARPRLLPSAKGNRGE